MILGSSHRRGTSKPEPRSSAATLSARCQTAEGRVLETRLEDTQLFLSVDGALALRLGCRANAERTLDLTLDEASPETPASLELLLTVLFSESSALQHVDLALRTDEVLAAVLLREGLLAHSERRDGTLVVRLSRAMFWQRPAAWLGARSEPVFPLSYKFSGDKRHPLRAPRRTGVVYRRHVAQLDSTVSFRTLDPVRDLEVFHTWMNDSRVSAFWELAGSRESHMKYIDTVLADAHMHPVVGCFDDQPFGYFELYWAKEDRIAPYYQVDDYDRGLHMLVGEQRFRGPERVAAWLSSLVHFLFLDDARTRNVVAEPRADNAKMIDYLRRAGFFMEKEFDFPHKRAAMMIAPRETFFTQYGP